MRFIKGIRKSYTKSTVFPWVIITTMIFLHSLFDVLRDGYFMSESIRHIIFFNWHILKIFSEFFILVAAIILWQKFRYNYEYIMGILIFRWGACEYCWNVLDKQYYRIEYKNAFMGISIWVAVAMLISGFILPILSNRIYFRIFK